MKSFIGVVVERNVVMTEFVEFCMEFVDVKCLFEMSLFVGLSIEDVMLVCDKVESEFLMMARRVAKFE